MQSNNILKQIKIKNYSNKISDSELQTFLSLLPELHKDIRIKLYILDNEKQFLFYELLNSKFSLDDFIKEIRNIFCNESWGKSNVDDNKIYLYDFHLRESYCIYEISFVSALIHEIHHQIYLQNNKLLNNKYEFQYNDKQIKEAEKLACDFAQDIITKNSEKLYQMYKNKYKEVKSKRYIEELAKILNPYRD